MNEAVELNKSCQNRQNLKFCESPKFFGNKENAKFDQIFSSNSRERSPKIYAKIPISKQTLNGFMLSSFHIMKKKIIEIREIRQTVEKNWSLGVGLGKYFLLKMKKIIPFLALSHDEEVFEKSEKIYEKELDYIEILKKLQDIDKLKRILLNKNQLVLFNLLTKPVLHLNDRMVRSSFSINLGRSSKKKEDNAEEDLKMALDYYEKEQDINEIDQRLFKILNDDIEVFF